MVIEQSQIVRCPGCKNPFILRQYEGLPDAKFGDHYCSELSEWSCKPENDEKDMFEYLPWGMGCIIE